LTFFEFILVITSVIYALSVAPLLAGLVRIAQSSNPVRHYPPQAIWVGNTFLLILLMWWSLWGFRSVNWTFSDFAYIAIEPVLLFFACSLLYPQRLDGQQVDLKSHFEKIRSLFYATTFVLIFLVSFDGVVLGIEPVWNVNRYYQAVVLAIIAWAYLDRRANSQLVASILYLVAALGFVGMRWFSPPV
jgi:amino acid transporter